MKKGEEYTLEQAFDSLIVQVNLIEQILIMKSNSFFLMGAVSLLAATGIIVTQTNCGQSDSSMLPTPAESSGTAAANEGGDDEKPVAIPEEKDSGAETVSSNGQDWPVWSGNGDGNLYSPEKGIAESFEPGKFKKGTEEIDMGTTTNVKWVAKLGSQAYGNTTVSNGKVFVGTNNESPRDERHIGDRGIVFDSSIQTDLSMVVVGRDLFCL